MKKRILVTALICAMVLTLMPMGILAYGEEYSGYTDSNVQQYTDVPLSHWASNSIKICSERNWFEGYPDGSFHPNSLIRRDEAAKVFVEALALPWNKDEPITFTDTKGNWAAGRIEASKYLFPDATNLAGTKSFRPSQTITREETIYALIVAWQYASKVATCDESVLNVFADANSISTGVRPYLAVAVHENLINGMTGDRGQIVINAQKGLTRAEFATMLARALEHGKGPDNTSAPKINFNEYSKVTSETNITITGNIVSSIMDGITLTCNGDEVRISTNGSFSVKKALAEGDNNFKFVATNSYGGSANQTVSIKKSVAPTIRILSEVPQKSAQKVIPANGNIDQYQTDCVLYLNNVKVSVDANGYFKLEFKLTENINSFELRLERKNEICDTKNITISMLAAEGAGQWTEKLPDSVKPDNYTIETKTQYRSKTKETQTSTQTSMPGWDFLYGASTWGSWSDWSSTPISASETIEVNTRQVEVAHTTTVYKYDKWAYINSSSKKWQSSHSQYTGPGYQQGSGKWEYLTTAEPLAKSGVYDGQQSYVAAGGWRWWHETVAQEPASSTYTTEYQYRSKNATVNTFARWSDWSQWTDDNISSSNTTQVETRTMYRYTLK